MRPALIENQNQRETLQKRSYRLNFQEHRYKNNQQTSSKYNSIMYKIIIYHDNGIYFRYAKKFQYLKMN